MNLSIFNFKKFVFSYVLPGILGLGLCLVSLDYFFTKHILLKTESEGAGYSKINRLLNNISEEIPVLGSSRALDAYIPDSISSNVYNYGLFDASFLTTNAFLNIELSKKKKSPIIVDVVYWDWFNIGELADYIPFAGNRHIDNLLKEVGQYKLIYLFPGLRYYGFYPHYIREYFNQFFKGNIKVNKGYVFHCDQNYFDRNKFNNSVRKRLNASLELGIASQRAALVDMRQKNMLFHHIKSNPHRHFYLIISPFHKSFFKTQAEIREGLAYFYYMSLLPNVTFLDLGNTNYPDSLFLNTTHLNHDGAVVFSKQLNYLINSKYLYK